MIGTIRKHQKWLWGIIITVTIITFVGFLSPSTKNSYRDDRPNIDYGSIKGEPITAEQFGNAQREETLFYFLRFREWPEREEVMRQRGFDMPQRTFARLMLIAKLKEMNIEVSDVAAGRFTKELFGVPSDQALPKEMLDKFLGELAQARIGIDDFDRFVRHQVGQQHLISLFGMNGKLLSSKEAEIFYRREYEPIQAEIVYFPLTNFYSHVTSTSKDIEEFFSKRQADYKLPERVQINYVKFESTNFFAEADKEMAGNTNLTDQINQIYRTDKYKEKMPELFQDEKGKPLTETESKDKIRKQFRSDSALNFAHKKAIEFSKELEGNHTDTDPFKPDDLEKLAKAKGLALKTTEPFDRENGPADFKAPNNFIHTAFLLRDDDPDDKSKSMIYALSPIVTKDAVYVIGLKRHFQSENQTLQTVHAKVMEDFKKTKAVELAKAAGEKFQLAATNGLAAHKDFAAICAAEKVKPVSLLPFSLASRSTPDVDDKFTFEQIQRSASELPAGKTSQFLSTSDGGFVLYIKARLPVDETKLKSELPGFLAKFRDQRMNTAYNEWFQKLYQEMHFVQPASMRSKSAG